MSKTTTQNEAAAAIRIVDSTGGTLRNSNVEKLRQFRAYAFAHPLLKEASQKLWRAVKDSEPGSLVLIYGPAGVGKTTLLRHVEKRINENLQVSLDSDREKIPFVKIEAKCPESGNFSWKTLYRDLLYNLSEPAVDKKLDLNKWRGNWESYLLTANNKSTPVDKLREVVEQAMKRRRPEGVFIDEAQHLTVFSSGRKLNDQQNTIKSIANRTETTHILLGSYDLLMLRDLSGQLARRSINIHFRRYDHTQSEDVNAFKNVIWQFQNKLPLEEKPDFVKEWRFLYERTVGCVGVLKEAFNRALSEALEEGCKTLGMRHLEKSVLSGSQSLRLLDEALQGEEVLGEDEEDLKELKNILWANIPDSKQIKIRKQNGEIKLTPPKAKKTRNPGVRNPTRDKVGDGRRRA